MSAEILNSLELKTTLQTVNESSRNKNISIKENHSSDRTIATVSDDQNSTKCENEEKMHKVDFNKYNTLAKGDEKKVYLKNIEDNTSTEGFQDLCFFNCFRKLFSFGKRSTVEKQLPQNEDRTPVSKGALETFSALMDEKNLSCLIGKEFTLNTSVSIQSIDQAKGSEPNLIIQGSIPFTVETPEGLKKKKVRVKGRLYNPSSDTKQSAGGDDCCSSSNVQRQHENKLNLVPVNMNFRPTLCVSEEIKWCKIEKYTQEEYQQSFYGCYISRKIPAQLKKLDGFVDPKTGEIRESSEGVPVKSITVTRFKVRHLKYSDGSKCKQTCGKHQMTLKMPRGVYVKKKDASSPETVTEESKLGEIVSYYDPSTEERRDENTSLVLFDSHVDGVICGEATKNTKRSKVCKVKKKSTPYDNAFTQPAYFCLQSYRAEYCDSERMRSSSIIYNKKLRTSVSSNALNNFTERNLYPYSSLCRKLAFLVGGLVL